MSDVNLFPGDGDIVCLEDVLDRLRHLCANTVTRDEADRVLATKLGGLEDVAFDGRIRADSGWGDEGLASGGSEKAL